MHEGVDWQSTCSSWAHSGWQQQLFFSAPLFSTKYLPLYLHADPIWSADWHGLMKYVKSRKNQQERVLVLWPFCFYQDGFFCFFYKGYIQLLWKYVLNWLLLRSWRLACRNIIPLHCILPPATVLRTTVKPLAVAYFATWYYRCWKIIRVQKQVEEINGGETCWVLIHRWHIQLGEVPVSKWLEAQSIMHACCVVKSKGRYLLLAAV